MMSAVKEKVGCHKKNTKFQICGHQMCFFQVENSPKPFSRLSQKNTKFQICGHQMCFFQVENAPKPFSPAGGAYDAPPDPLVGWGGGNPLPSPLDAFGASFLALPNTNSWVRPCSDRPPCLLLS